ncbi:MAG: hypothetical protein EOP04_00630 [Proteobacteria bacterium]|nr:MAG: hypothetical protein EOP04_00630 [Pseudomonadota bacterium]
MATKGDFDRKLLNRLKNGKRVSSDSAFKILEVVYQKDYFKIYSELRRLYPSEAWIESTWNSLSKNKMTSPAEPYVNKFFQRSVTTQDIGSLLLKESGISKLVIQRVFGEPGLMLVNTLIEDKKVIELENGSVRFEAIYISLDAESMKSILINAALKYDTASFGSPGSMLGAYLWSSTELGMSKIKDIFAKAFEDAGAVQRANPGEISFSVSAVMVKTLFGVDERNAQLDS